MSSLSRLRGALGALSCAVAGHRYVVWVRPDDAVTERHPHLGAWARCARCGAERDWLWGGIAIDDPVIDRVHGDVRPLRDVLAIARGQRGLERDESTAARAPAPRSRALRSARPIRRGGGDARGSRGGEKRPRSGRGSERDPR